MDKFLKTFDIMYMIVLWINSDAKNTAFYDSADCYNHCY